MDINERNYNMKIPKVERKLKLGYNLYTCLSQNEMVPDLMLDKDKLEFEEFSICSIHKIYNPDCNLCNTKIKLSKETKNLNIIKCQGCMFEYYDTTQQCPKCNRYINGKDID